jgi:HlyD family secretion protein
MVRKSLLPLLALIGAVIAVVVGNQAPDGASPAVQPMPAPFAFYVAGAGIVETSTENIAIGTPVSGIVATIYVKWGDWVNAGDPLFKIDDRDLQAQLLPAEAKVKEAEAGLSKLKNILSIGERLGVGPISALELANRRFDVAVAEAVLGSARAQVEQLRMEAERRTIRAPVAARVLQIKTHLGDPAVLPAYVGQQMDVFIEAPLAGPRPERGAASRQ